MKLTNLERETIILFNEAEGTASVYTFTGRLQRELCDLCKQRPEEVKQIAYDDYGSKTYKLPKKWVKIRAPRVLSEAEKEAKRKAMQKMLAERIG